VARVFEPAARAFLRDAAVPPPDLVIDLGCGPGYTTQLLAEVLQPARPVGLDRSPEFIERARRLHSSRLSFLVHDVTAVPFPVGPADVLYSRLLLTHLDDPIGALAGWASQLVSGGVLMLDEVESIRTNSPVLERYLEVLDQMLRSQSNCLYIGPKLDAALPPTLVKRTSRIRRFPVAAADAATMFAMNLKSWRDHPFVRKNIEENEIRRMEQGLEALRTGASEPAEIVWGLRQIVCARSSSG
jgi:ubiquinone/menaquinone biosynthesis C-methylase UbiE